MHFLRKIVPRPLPDADYNQIRLEKRKLLEKIKKKEQELRRKRQMCKYSKKVRVNHKQALERFKTLHPNEAASLSVRDRSGRPRYEETAEGRGFVTFLKAICEKYTVADPTRRSTLDVCVLFVFYICLFCLCFIFLKRLHTVPNKHNVFSLWLVHYLLFIKNVKKMDTI